MILARRATLRPSPEQARAFGRSCGAARWAWNWGLGRKIEAWDVRKAALAAGVDKADAPKVPTAIGLHRELNKLKKIPVEDGGVPWMYEVSKCAPQEALRDLDLAFQNFFRRVKAGETPGFPRFKARGRAPGHFRLTGSIKVVDGRVELPRVGLVRVMPGDRGYIPDGTYTSASVVEDGAHWCVSVRLDVPEAPGDDTRPTVGLDAGVRDLAYLSDGTVIPNPKALKREEKRLRRSRLAIARKRRAADKRLGAWKKGERRVESKRLQATRRRAARLHRRVANIRCDALHKATTWIAKTYRAVAVEDLHGKNMTRRRRGKGRAAKAGLNRSILDSGMLRLRPLLAYKMPLHGGRLNVVPAPNTSRTCNVCSPASVVAGNGPVRNNPGKSKTYKCATCGTILDRDLNASLNIKAAASCTAELTGSGPKARRGATVSPKARAGRHVAVIRQSDGGVSAN